MAAPGGVPLPGGAAGAGQRERGGAAGGGAVPGATRRYFMQYNMILLYHIMSYHCIISCYINILQHCQVRLSVIPSTQAVSSIDCLVARNIHSRILSSVQATPPTHFFSVISAIDYLVDRVTFLGSIYLMGRDVFADGFIHQIIASTE